MRKAVKDEIKSQKAKELKILLKLTGRKEQIINTPITPNKIYQNKTNR